MPVPGRNSGTTIPQKGLFDEPQPATMPGRGAGSQRPENAQEELLPGRFTISRLPSPALPAGLEELREEVFNDLFSLRRSFDREHGVRAPSPYQYPALRRLHGEDIVDAVTERLAKIEQDRIPVEYFEGKVVDGSRRVIDFLSRIDPDERKIALSGIGHYLGEAVEVLAKILKE